MIIWTYIEIEGIELYIKIKSAENISSVKQFSLHRPTVAKIIFQSSNRVFSETTGMRNLILYFQVAPTALGPMPSCRASETNGN